MAAEEEPVTCDICRKGRVLKRMEEMAFRQSSDKGYVRCHVMVLIGTCEACGAKSLDPGSTKILDDAFQKEYAKLRTHQ
jgi:hypothetical protein